MLTPLGLIGIFACLLAWPVASERATPNRLYLFLSLLALHIAASIAYYLYAQTGPADSSTYFFDRQGLARWDFALGTVFTVKLVQLLRDTLGGTYFDYFLIFQAIGFWGIAILMRTLQEVHIKLGVEETGLSQLLLFLPGVHFWTSAIGKDAPLFLGASLAVWAAMRLPARLLYFVLAVGLMMLFRPHIALIAVASFASAEFFNPRPGLLRKAGLLTVALGGLAAVGATIRTTFRVDVTSAESLSSFFESQQAVSQEIAGTTAVLGASYPGRVLSLLFRPFFFDGSGPYAMIASLENVVYVFIVGLILLNLPLTFRLSRRIFFVRFTTVFAAMLIMMLAMVYYNVGLGARQKTMIVPALFCLVAVLWAIRRNGLEKLPMKHPTAAPRLELGGTPQRKHA